MASQRRPYVFIGSSREGLEVAKAIQAELQYSAECEIWSQGVFGLSKGGLESLVGALDKYDFAILVLTPDDLVEKRGAKQAAPRDNVLLELGMFIGALGRERAFMIVDRSAEIILPSDLAGITPATFQPPEQSTWKAAVGAACYDIDVSIKKLGVRKGNVGITVLGGFGFRRGEQRLRFTVTNVGNDSFPPHNIALFHPKGGICRFFDSEKSGSLLPGQQRVHECVVFEPKNGLTPLPNFATQFVSPEDENELRFRIMLEDSDNRVLYENKAMGIALVRILRSVIQNNGLTCDITQDDWLGLNSEVSGP